ncbi:EamA family transporter [Nocardioides sp. ChNu-99]|uniref:EamA family transporter n=1 Tax=Nocardioides sp. ChNu-99 TaxID=2839897 RepID=UPI0024057CC7|nr:EamA family transporter [Nocardioides sp. ChNu-99]MDF9715495.1 DMT family transporter [Nocardioides sp. ChNu-99]
MTTLTPDTPVAVVPGQRLGAGLLLALTSASAFGMSGALARGLLDAGWTAGAAVTARVSLAALVLLVPAVLVLRGRWGTLLGQPRTLGTVALYGVLAVAGAQLCYFYAVSYLQVGVALLIEYTAPVAVIVWMWLRHGQRPGRTTVAGAAVAAVGLAMVLGVVGSGVDLDVVGVLWGLGAMIGCAAYFVISADGDNGLPGTVLAAGGLTVGALTLGTAGLVGVLPMAATTADVVYGGTAVPWWLPVLGLGLVTAALAYTTGIAASRRLGSRLASFVALSEVVMALVFAWLLLGELPGPLQLVGGLLILAGVIVVKLGEAGVQEVRIGEPESAEVAEAG